MSDIEEDEYIEEDLDDEIATLQKHIESIKQKIRVQATTIVTSDWHQHLILDQPPDPPIYDPDEPPTAIYDSFAAHLAAQNAHDQQSLYRLCAGITSFRVTDPDPHAVDSGKVFGLRFDIFTDGQFNPPCFILLNRPWAPNNKAWKVHRHTAPVGIPLAAIAERFLPAPEKNESYDEDTKSKQDVVGFARAVRRELYRLFNRVGAIAYLRCYVLEARKRALQTHGDGLPLDRRLDTGLVDMGSHDPEIKQISLACVDGRIARLVIDDDGNIQQAVVYKHGWSDLVTAQRLMGNGIQPVKVEEVLERLQEDGGFMEEEGIVEESTMFV